MMNTQDFVVTLYKQAANLGLAVNQSSLCYSWSKISARNKKIYNR